MNIADLIAGLFQGTLGNQYKIYCNEAFNKYYTKPVKTPLGEQVDFNYDAFDVNKDFIVGTVKTNNPITPYTPYTLALETYTAQFWVPLDFLEVDAHGRLLSTPKFNFYGDMDKLESSVKYKELRLKDDGKEYKAFITSSKPSLVSNQIEKSGSYKRAVFQVIGNINVADLKIGSGSDIKITLEIDGKESEIVTPINLGIGTPTEANAEQNVDNLEIEQDVASINQEIRFEIDDYITTEAEKLIEKKVWKNVKTLTSTTGNSNNQLKVLTRLYKNKKLMIKFWGVLSAEYRVDGRAGFGRYSVSLSNDGKEEVSDE